MELSRPAPISVAQQSATSPADRRMAEVGVLVVMVIWAANFIVVKSALSELPPFAFTLLRFVLAAIALLVVCRIREGSIALPRRDILPLAALGALGFGIYSQLWTLGLGQTTAGDSALLLASTPIFTLLLAAAIRSDVLTPARFVGTIVSFVGVGLVVLSAVGSGVAGHLFGDAVTLLGAALWAAYVSFGAPVLRRHSPLRTTAWAVFFGTLIMLPLGLWQLATVDWRLVSVASGAAVVYAGVISVALGNVLQFRAVAAIGPARTTAFQFLVPALTVVLAAIFLGEGIRIEQIAGGIVIVLGIFIARRGRLSRPTAAARA